LKSKKEVIGSDNVRQWILLLLVLLILPARGHAQEGLPKFEAGPLVQWYGMLQTAPVTASGGGRVTYNVRPFLAGEFQIVHRGGFSGFRPFTAGLGHLKLTLRRVRASPFSLFAVGGAGFYRETISGSRGSTQSFQHAAFDYGIGVEYEARRWMALRLGFSDVYVRDGFGSHRTGIDLAAMFRF
jgi:hypothetical protein